MTLPATDSFTDSDGVQLSTHNSAWVLNEGDFDIQSNRLCQDAGAAGYSEAHWSGDTFSNDQYSQITATVVDTTQFNYNGVCVRAAASAVTCYGLIGEGHETILYKVVAGTRTTLGTGPAIANGDVLRLEVTGTSVRPMLNGSTISAIGIVTDSSISSGSAGVAGYLNDPFFRTLCESDNWEGGNLGGNDALTGQNLATGAPVLGSPTITQTHILTGAGIATGSPVLGQPSFSGGNNDLVASGIATAAPVLGHPTLTQYHVLTANNLVTGAPVFGHPELNPPIATTPEGRILVIEHENRVFPPEHENRIFVMEA